MFEPYKFLTWYAHKEGRILFAAFFIPLIIVTIWGSYPDYQYKKKTEELSEYFFKENLTFIISHSSGNGVFIKLNYSDGNPKRNNNDQIKQDYRKFIIQKVCNYPHYIKKLKMVGTFQLTLLIKITLNHFLI
ncbi:hypothetical protein WNY51_02565 [Pseudocolwellia sp. AS88]|uniref:hypothetical protein n=1 Tax=Pseudocolwellia sp. AS88 TaxID=3063958 RepID=UPI0026EEC368|nr:hypothetical protein [Pseudocolwellia sp. AS88]MDO7084474.1 hypothetical protein [Pseudocolwellia sp. AS88]